MNLRRGLEGSSSGSRLSMMIGSTGFIYGESDNSSEDLSGSLSSTAASVAKLEFDKSVETEVILENGNLCNPKEKSSCSDTVQMSEHREGGVRSKKKHRRETVEPEKDNSYTNLRNSGASFMGVKSSSEMSSGGRHSEEVQIENVRESGGDSNEDASQYDLADISSWKPKEKGEHKASESHLQQPTSSDPLVGSIVLLQAVQEALEKEIEHFREIGKNQVTSFSTSRRDVNSNTEICSIDQVIYVDHCSGRKLLSGFEDMETSSKVNAFQKKLEETLTMLDATESKVAELERILSKNDWVKGKSAGSRSSISNSQSLQYLKDKSTEMENEVKTLLKKKLEAEKEYYQQLDEIRKTMSSKKQSGSKLVASEKEGLLLLKAEREEEELMSKDKGKLLKMKDSIYKYCFCLVVQLIFFLFVLVFWMSNLPQQSVGPAYVPT
ncbi:hypothetical protein MKW94_007163 [Papaver nudicaule]|uniref:Uncharacterized protein n=1 Tax=Papaver nudicaule TaxID=74823 RepID=A0AA41VYY8_PAPNU|nr:hypothetical protein [Papaver nudicaule]